MQSPTFGPSSGPPVPPLPSAEELVLAARLETLHVADDADGDDVADEEVDAGEDEEPTGDEPPLPPPPAAVASSSTTGTPTKPKSKHDLRRTRRIKWMSLTKYDSVWSTTEKLGWTPVEAEQEDSHDWNVCWSDTSVAMERIMRLGRLQKINHFPGMLELVRKAGTARNLNKMLKLLGKEYKFFPRTFMLPADYTELKREFGGKGRGNKTFIVKPSKGCQGKDIFMTRSLDDIDPHEPNIVQRYMHKPHLLDGYKYDLRLYVLLSSLSPMRIYLFREGLVRVCTEKYNTRPSNLTNSCMHLTNYAINKDNDAFVQPDSMEDDGAHKRTITSLMQTLAAEGHDTDALWEDIGELCVKTLISVQPHLEHTYFTCRQARRAAPRRLLPPTAPSRPTPVTPPPSPSACAARRRHGLRLLRAARL